MASYENVEIQKLATVTSATAQTATFDAGVQSLVITSDQDIYINFDGHPVSSATNQGFLVKGGVTNNQWIFPGSTIKKVHAVAVSTSANVYLMGIRGQV